MNMKNRERTPRLVPTTLTGSGQEASCAAHDNGTLRGWWRRAIGDIRTLLAAAKHGDEVEENLDMAYALLEHLRLTVTDRVRRACSCEGSQALKESLSLLDRNLHGAMMDVLLALVIAESAWGTGNPLTGPITSALRQVPTIWEIGWLAPELGSVRWRDGIPMRCWFCGP